MDRFFYGKRMDVTRSMRDTGDRYVFFRDVHIGLRFFRCFCNRSSAIARRQCSDTYQKQ